MQLVADIKSTSPTKDTALAYSRESLSYNINRGLINRPCSGKSERTVLAK